MALVADVKLSWKKSPSADIASVKVVVVQNGTETTADVGPEVEEFVIVVAASSTVTFRVETTDSEGRMASSASYSFSVGDLEQPLPATDLSHEILGIREVDETAPEPEPV